MKHTLKVLIALMMLAAILLTGCSKQSDTMKNIESQKKTYEENLKTVVAEYDGGTVTAMEAMPIFASYYSYYYQIYSMFGQSIDDETLSSLKSQVLEYMVQCRLLEAEFDKRGLELDKTEEEYNAEWDENYNSQLDSYVSQLSESSSYSDYSDEELKAYAELLLYSSGMTLENNRRLNLMNEKVEKVVAAIEDEAELPTEEEMNTYYTERLAKDEETYTATPTGVESAMSNGSSVCWMPEGYRTVKHILIVPEDDVLSAVTDARSSLSTAQTELATLENELAEVTGDTADETADAAAAEETAEAESAETTEEAADTEATEETTDAEATEEVEAEATEAPRSVEEIQADITAKNAEIAELEQSVADAESACLASVQEKIDSVYAALESGSDFESVMEEYGEDPGMQSEPNKTTGYYVREDSAIWDENFTKGSMALEKVGDYSATPVISSSGVHIIYYASDVTPGAVPYESVYDTLYAEKTEAKRSEYLTEQLNAWIEAANPVYHADEWVIQ